MKYPRAMGKTSFYMMNQIMAIWQELTYNPECKIHIYSVYEAYFEGLIKLAKTVGFDLEMTIPKKDKESFVSIVVSLKKSK